MSCVLSPPRIPLELVERVIDSLHYNVPALHQFAIVCRDLLPRSRYHLFYAIRFQPTQEDAYSLCDFLDANPLLHAIIQVVAVHFPDRFRPARPVIEVFPARLIRRLTHLRHWKLFTGATSSPETPLSFHHTTLTLLRTTNCIETLELKDLTFTSNTELVRLLTSIPQLRSLRCSNISVRSHHATKLQRRPSWSVRVLCVSTNSPSVYSLSAHVGFNSSQEGCLCRC